MFILFASAVIPGLFLMRMIYNQDKIEKEPSGLLLKLFILGALTTISAMILEVIGDLIINFLPAGFLYNLIENFIVVACAEEGGKYFMLRKGTWKNPAFDYRFDAVVYAVFTSMGFAVLENILYVIQSGLGTAIMRAITSLPGHMIFGIFMGIYYGEAKLCSSRGDEDGCRRNLKMAFLVPVLIHGFYDFCLSEDTLGVMVFLVFIIILYVFAFRTVKQASATDTPIAPQDYEVPMPGQDYGYIPGEDYREVPGEQISRQDFGEVPGEPIPPRDYPQDPDEQISRQDYTRAPREDFPGDAPDSEDSYHETEHFLNGSKKYPY